MLPEQLSVANGDELTEAEHCPVIVGKEDRFASGGWLSVITTLKLQLDVPQALFAVIETAVVPVLNVEPLPFPLPLPVVAPLKV